MSENPSFSYVSREYRMYKWKIGLKRLIIIGKLNLLVKLYFPILLSFSRDIIFQIKIINQIKTF